MADSIVNNLRASSFVPVAPVAFLPDNTTPSSPRLPVVSNTEEQAYLDFVRQIIETGSDGPDRTETGTRAISGAMFKYSLRNGSFPLFTTKDTNWNAIKRELLWMLRGSTSAKELDKEGVKIWNANGSRKFLNKQGLEHYEEGDLGPVYGFQWRHFGAEYVNMETDYSGKGVDQLVEVIRLLKHEPHSRRILMSAWNPLDLHKMALPPCHVLSHFNVINGELHCCMFQRSADMGLGVPFNVASYALLTNLLAYHCGLQPGTLTHHISNAHVYLNHIPALQEQIKRVPRAFPRLLINADLRQLPCIDAVTPEQLVLLDYNPYPKIKMEMAV